MLKTSRNKLIVLFVVQICVFLFSMDNFAYGVDFNTDIKKVTLDYYYYEGFGEDKVVQSIEDESWHILKPDGCLINLKGDYLAYAGTEGKNLNFNDDYYRFVIGNDSYHTDYSTRFIYVDKNGLECFVEGYTFVNPTKGENYFILRNIKVDGYETGLYHKYNKTVVIPTLYDTLNYINDDRITACKNDRYGLINIKQEKIIPFAYKYIDYLNDNFIIAVNEDGKYGVINIDNELVLPFEYDEISNISESNDYYRISKNSKFGLVETVDAEIVIPLEYDDIEYAENELAVALKDGQKGVIDANCEEVVPFIYDSIMYYDGGFVVFKDELAGFLNKEGKIILPVEYFNILEVKDGFITVVINYENDEHKYAVYDMNGKEIVPPIYDNIDYYATDKYMIVKKGWYAYFIDKATGKEMLANSDLHFSDVKYINDKYYAGGGRSSYAIVNFAGQRLTLESYNDISIINVNGEDIIAAKYNTERFDTHFDYFEQTNGPSTWAIEEVSKAIENNLVPYEYQAAFTFNIKRYEFCSIIVTFLEEYYNTTRDDIIMDNNIDVINPPIEDGFNEDVAICLHLGIVNGRGNGIFDGESEITREETAVMLTNLSKYLGLDTKAEEVSLNDKSEVSSWANDDTNFVLQSKMMQGTGNNMFSPKSKLTREQTYIIMYRILNDTEFYSLYSKASEAWSWFYVDTMPWKATPGSYGGIITELKEYNEVDYEGIETLKDLENYLKTIFSCEKVEDLLNTGRYFDIDGTLCTVVMGRGTNHTYGKIVEVNANNIDENIIEYIVSVEKLDDNFEVEGYEKFTFITEKLGDAWVFTEFPAWW